MHLPDPVVYLWWTLGFMTVAVALLTRLVPAGVTDRLRRVAFVVPALLGGVCAVLQFYAWVYAASACTPTPTGRLLTVPFEGNWSIEHPKPVVALALAAAVALAVGVGWSVLPSSAGPAPGLEARGPEGSSTG